MLLQDPRKYYVCLAMSSEEKAGCVQMEEAIKHQTTWFPMAPSILILQILGSMW